MIPQAPKAFLAALVVLVSLLAVACGSGGSALPRDLLLGPGDFPGGLVTVVSLTEGQSLGGRSAQVELEASGYRVVQSLVLFDNGEGALAALDGIRADLVSGGETGAGGAEASGMFEHMLGQEGAASVFFIEGAALVRLTATGPDRQQRLDELSDLARRKLAGN